MPPETTQGTDFMNANQQDLGGSSQSALQNKGILTLNNVYGGYGGGDVLKGTSFTVYDQSITCIVGPNGAGKSTVATAISGLLTIREGEITLDGEPLHHLKPRQILQKGIVQVPQNHSLFRKMSVEENVEFGGFLVRDRQIIKKRFADVCELFPIVKEKSTTKAGALSGGQQRLVEFARCMMLSPRIVILDEPTLGLDPQMARTVLKTITHMNKSGVTVLLVEQNARAALRMSSHAVVLESGQVRLIGSGKEVLENPEIGTLYLGGTSQKQ